MPTKKTKAQIYSDTKMFIAETWKSANDVIQNDDKDGGMILVKGTTIQNVSIGMSKNSFTYSYNVKFLMKENKFKILVENLNYNNGPTAAWDGYDLKPQEVFPGLIKAGISKKVWTGLMESLKIEMQSIVDRYEKAIKLPAVKGDW